ncbi:MAG: DUF368 domain-containing protein [Flavobacteriales bacterium]|nr:DUF368 domain-containing protein [Flavobacteriales bacterium]
MSKRTIKDYLLISVKGLGMGAADVVPGVSGGTVAFITGIYEELLTSISSINLKALKVLKNDGLKAFWEHVNGWFFVALLGGIGVSVVSLAKVATYFMDHHPVPLWSFFFGLVAASIFYVGKQVKKKDFKALLAFILGTAIAYGVTILPPLVGSDSLGLLFLAGMIAICAMILPGISGSFILLILGAYQIIMEAVHQMDLVIIGVVGAGAVIGLLSFSRVLKWLFEKHESITIALLTGFLLGSLNKLWPWKHVTKIFVKHPGEAKEQIIALSEQNVLPSNFDKMIVEGEKITGYELADPQIVLAVISALAGFILIFGIEFLAKKLGKPASE